MNSQTAHRIIDIKLLTIAVLEQKINDSSVSEQAHIKQTIDSLREDIVNINNSVM